MTVGLLQFGASALLAATTGGFTMGLSGVQVYTGAYPLLNWRYCSTRSFGLGVTFTGGGSADIVSAGHGMKVGYSGDFSGSAGSLPSGVNNTLTYFIVTSATNTFQLSATKGGSPITFSTTGSGNITFRANTECAWNAGWLDDTTGDLKSPVVPLLQFVQVAWWTIQPGATIANQYLGLFDGEQFDVTWLGTATGTKPSFSTYNSGASTIGANSAAIVLTNPATGSANVGIQFAITNVNDPPRGFFISQHRYASNVAAGQRWNPDFLTSLRTTDAGGTRPFGRIRFMDMISTNNNQAVGADQLSGFSDFNLFGAFQPAAAPDINTPMSFGTYSSTGLRGGIHPEIMVSLANTLGVNVHANVPAGFSNAGFQAFAQYFKDNLNSNLHVLFEYGNENTFSFNFMGYRYIGAQPYPALGGSAPYQTATTIISATAGSPTNINATAHGLVSGNSVNPTFVGGTMANVNNAYNKLTITKIDNDNFTINLNTTGLTFSAGTYINQNAPAWSGYRAAQLWDMARTIFGTSSSATNSRWRGTYNAQGSTPSSSSGVQVGIDFYLTNEAAGGTKITDLFSSVVVAPYFGEFVTSNNVTGVSPGLNPTVTMGNSFTNGQAVRVFVTGGTMASVLDGTVSYTVSSRTSSNFEINADTTGLTYGSGNNFAFLSSLYVMIDASIAGNGSDPVTNPNKYSLFTRELSNALINGTNSYGYTPNTNFAVPNITTFDAAGHARIVHKRGLHLEQYEGMFNMETITGNVMSNETKINEFILNAKFQPEIAPTYQAVFTAFRNNYARYPAKYVNAGAGGPWQGLRQFPGDASNGQWQALVAENELGVFVDTTPAATWSRTFNSGDQSYASGNGTTASLTFTSPGGLAVIVVTNIGGQTVTGAQIDGAGAMTIDGAATSSWTTTVLSQVVTAGSHTVVVTFSATTPNRSVYAVTLQGLLSTTKRAVLAPSTQSRGFLKVLKGGAVVGGCCASSASTNWNNASCDVVPAAIIDHFATQNSQFVMWDPGQFLLSDNGYQFDDFTSNGMMCVSYL